MGFFWIDYCDPDNETSVCQGLTFEALFPDGTYGMTFDGLVILIVILFKKIVFSKICNVF